MEMSPPPNYTEDDKKNVADDISIWCWEFGKELEKFLLFADEISTKLEKVWIVWAVYASRCPERGLHALSGAVNIPYLGRADALNGQQERPILPLMQRVWRQHHSLRSTFWSLPQHVVDPCLVEIEQSATYIEMHAMFLAIF
ncbi:hypothetical protein JTE90_018424 [Oedothorax gibbosus]|uniref:Uncharacterized protein n=1 Tax=Oedothorax gibbosus TaxID=931172 RepID=A0AAV6UXQ8_9ARAC|nr:hypothetical protein JTE90_018424 [Oedothorax gibbosus]